MAKKRKKKKGGSPRPPQAKAPEAVVESVVAVEGPPPSSAWERFWTRPFHPTRLALFRFFFFACVAFESFRDLEHAPRYGAGGFNVPHFDVLALFPVPSRYWMVVLLLAQFALALRVAIGLGGRVTVWALTAIYGYTYFISQLDSYQHHYMVFLFLVLMSLVDWEAERPRAWPIHLVIVQTCIVYFWAGVTKVQPLWVDGTLLKMQVGGGDFHAQVQSITGRFMEPDTAYALMADYSMAAEFCVPLLILYGGTLPDGVLRSRLGWLAAAVGLPLHIGIEFAGLKIGLFSYMMVAFYLLVVPDRPFDVLDGVFKAIGGGLRSAVDGVVGSRADLAMGVALAFTGWTVWRLPLEYTGAAAGVVTGVALLSEWPPRAGRARRAIGHLLVGLTVLYAAGTGETMRKYWYYLGGDARRRGEVSLAIYGYSNTTLVDPSYPSGYVRHAMMLGQSGRSEEARRVLETGIELADPSFDLYEALAYRCQQDGDQACAKEAASQAIAIKMDPRLKAIADR